MDWLAVFQLISIPVSILSLVVTSIIAIRTSNSQNIANIVATQRINFLEQYRQLTSELLTLCTPLVLKSGDVDVKQIVRTAYTLKSIFRTCYEEEREIEISINNLVNTTLDFIKNPNNKKIEDALNNNISHLIELMEVYDLAYWRFIIDQSVGSRFKVDDFEVYYSNAEQRFKDVKQRNAEGK